MSTQNWIDRALTGEPVWDIGQIDAATANALNGLVKRGALVKSRLSFCGISPLKTVWHLPRVEVDIGARAEPAVADKPALVPHDWWDPNSPLVAA